MEFRFQTSRQVLAFSVRARQLIDGTPIKGSIRQAFGCAEVSLTDRGGGDTLSGLVEDLVQAAKAIAAQPSARAEFRSRGPVHLRPG